MCGGSGTTTQQVTIPPEVLARYNAVNAQAEQVAATPFQQYSTDPSAFVAQLNPTQQAGIQNVSNAQNIAQPYFQGATSQLMAGQNAATPYYGQATQELMGGLQAGMTGTQGAYQPMAAGAQQAQDLQGGAYGQYQNALQTAQPYNQAATAGIMGGLAGSQGYNAMAGQGYNQAQAGAQPYLGAATGLGLAGTQAVNATPLGGNQINQYMSPYLNSVVGSTMANLRQQQGQEQSSLLGDQISQGAFGGDRGGIAQANLARQQELATGQTVSGLMNQGYSQALGAAQQQQQVGLGAAQANRAALQQGAGQLAALGQQGYAQGMGTAQAQQGLGQQIYGQGLGAGQALAGIGQQQYGQQSGIGQNLAALGQQQFGQGAAQTAQQAALAQQQYGMGLGASQQLAGLGQAQYGMGAATSQALAGLGTQAQQNALGAAQAQIGAGTLAQQTQQAGQTALYNQFLQQQGYPFQTTQFLANIAEGTGALSGSTTTTNQPMPFFSDERLKEAVEPIGKTFDGQKIVKFRYKNEPGTRIGLIAQDVEKHHPDAVGLAGGYKTVDYDAATKEAAHRGHYARGGLAPESEGGAVLPFPMRRGFAEGGNPAQLSGNPAQLINNTDLAAILQAQFGMYNNQGIPGLGGSPGMTGFVPEGTLPVGNLTVAGDAPKLPESQLKGMLDDVGGVKEAYDTGKQVVKKIKRQFNTDEENAANDAAEQKQAADVAYAAEQRAASARADAAQRAAAAANTATTPGSANGGLVGHYASGGASSGPYGVPISKVETPDLITAGDAPDFQKSGFLKMMDMAGDAASLGKQGVDTYNSATKSNGAAGGAMAAGGAAEDDVGAGTPYDAGSNPFMPDSAKGIEKKELAKPGAAPGAPESGFGQAMGLAKDVGSIAALAMMMNRGGRIGKEDGGPTDYSTLTPAEKVALNARLDAQLNAAGNNLEAPQESTPVPAARPVAQVAKRATLSDVDNDPSARLDIPEGFLKNKGAPPPLPEFVNPSAPTGVAPKFEIENPIQSLIKRANDPNADISANERHGLLAQASESARSARDTIVAHNLPSVSDELYGLVPNYFKQPSAIAQEAERNNSRNATLDAALNAAGVTSKGRPIPSGNIVSAGQPPASTAPLKPSAAAAASPVKKPGVAPPLPAPINVAAPPPIRSEETGVGMTPGLGGGNAPAPAQAPVDTHAAEGALLARTGLGAPNIRQDLAQPQAPQPPKPGFLERAGNTLAPKGGYLDRLSQGDEDAVVPLLTGLGAMASSSNRYGLGALAEGIGAGAAAYQPTKQAILERGVTQAGIGRTQQGTFNLLQANAPDRMQVVEGPGGPGQKSFTVNGVMYHYEPKGSFINAGTPGAQTPASVSPDAINTMGQDAFRRNNGDVRDADIALSGVLQDSVVGAGRTAYTDMQNQASGIETLTRLPTKGAFASGQNQPLFQNIVGKLTDFVSRMGVAKYLGDEYNSANMNNPSAVAGILDKITGLDAFNRASRSDQNSMMGLAQGLKTAISMNNPKAANAYLAATTLVGDRMALDEQDYSEAYRQEVSKRYPGQDAYLAQSMDSAFRKDPRYTQDRYRQEFEALNKFIANMPPDDVKAAFSGAVSADDIDKSFMENFKIPNMSRYFKTRVQ